VAEAPSGTQACSLDIKAFHCTCLIRPDHKPWLVVSVNGAFYMDHCAPFGLRSASGSAGMTCNAMVGIWDAETGAIVPTGTKPDTRTGVQAPLREVRELHGTLCHIAFIFEEGSSHVSAFSNLFVRYRDEPYIKRKYSSAAVCVLDWWNARLADKTAFRQLRPLGPLQDLGLFVALELLIHFLGQLKFQDVHLRVYSDNKGAIGALTKGRSPNTELNLCARRTKRTSLDHMILTDIVYVDTSLNIADAPSGGESPYPLSDRLTRAFDLPYELEDLFVRGDW
jgi:hypothetical protein